METKKAKGREGWWFAEVDGEAFPCLHKYWLNGLSYHDPFERHAGKSNGRQLKEYVDAIKKMRRIVLTNDKATVDNLGEVISFKRENYIAVYSVDDVDYSPEDGLRLRLSDRLYNLK